MNKLLALLVFFIVLYLLLTKRKRPSSEESAARGSAGKAPEKMVRCAYCGVHLPASESVSLDDGRHYCGEEHRRLDVDGPRR